MTVIASRDDDNIGVTVDVMLPPPPSRGACEDRLLDGGGLSNNICLADVSNEARLALVTL